jgi:hypothetical protein
MHTGKFIQITTGYVVTTEFSSRRIVTKDRSPSVSWSTSKYSLMNGAAELREL